jgi:hypothetical protein
MWHWRRDDPARLLRLGWVLAAARQRWTSRRSPAAGPDSHAEPVLIQRLAEAAPDE